MKIAVIADPHIPDCDGSAEEAALDWAVQTCRSIGVDVVVFAGDLTACGRRGELDRTIRILSRLRLPWVCTPGNSDLRTPQTADRARALLAKPAIQRLPDATVLALDTADGTVHPRERERFERTLAAVRNGPSVVVVTHWPPNELPEPDRAWFSSVLAGGRVELVLAGHKHRDAETELAGVPIFLVRGLDPEKAAGSPPALTVFVRECDGWNREEIIWAEGDPRSWPEEERREFLVHLGISTMSRTLADAERAASLGIPVLELRAGPAMETPRKDLAGVIARWRKSGGSALSVHLPDLRWDAAQGRIGGLQTMKAAVDLTVRLGADQVTVHVPRASVAEMETGSAARRAMLDAFAGALQPLAEAGVVVGIENLHLVPNEPSDERRRFGCTPPECLSWVRDLSAILPSSARIGLLLDLAHARNNAPLSQAWTLGRWIAEAGPQAVGYHLHQVTAGGNHQPLHDPFGPAISLSAFFWAWRTRRIAAAPMFLEIREESAVESFHALRDVFETQGFAP